MKILKRYISKFPNIRHYIITILSCLRLFGPIQKIIGDRVIEYTQWIETKKLSPSDYQTLKAEINQFKFKPTMSLIMPVYNVNPIWLELAIQSIKNQIYPNWELCLVDDGSTRVDTIQYVSTIHHQKIKKKKLTENKGIAFASNTAIDMACGEYLVIMDHDDLITEDALLECVRAINDFDPDLIYSDEDRVGTDGVRKKPFFKPDWSLELLRSQNYICHMAVIKSKIMEIVGGFKDGFEGAQDYDLFLRISEITDRIYHIPKVLYSWREIDTSTNINPIAKPMAQSSGLKAVNSHLKREYGGNAWASESDNLFVYDSRYDIPDDIFISIIIPTKDQVDYLDGCIASIVNKTAYKKYEIIVLNNNSEKIETQEFFSKATVKYPQLKVIDAPYPFNWSKLNNQGVRHAKGEVFVFLNNDTQVISEDWLQRLAEGALREDIGAVGPLLLYDDESIQHAGVIVGMGGWADHVYKGIAPQHTMNGYVSPMVKRNVLALTGSCLAVSKKTIRKIGGFNEGFIVCGSDVELCLRAYENGLRNLYDPFVKLYHFESKTRNPNNIPDSDFKMSRKYYQTYWKNGDPYYNTNLSLMSTSPSLNN